MGVYKIENVIYPKNVHLYARWLKWCFLHLKMLSTPLCKCFSIIFTEEYLPLIGLTKMVFSTLKMSSTRKIVMVFIHLKISSTWRIYTSLQVFFQFFHWRIFIFVRVEKNGVFYTWKWGLPEEYTLLSERFSIVSLMNLSIMVFPTLKYVLFPRNVHTSVSRFFHLRIFASDTSVFKPEIFFTWRIYTFVQVE